MLLDTDILIDALNGQADAVAFIANHSDEELLVSIVSLGEVFDGAAGAPDPARRIAEAQGFLAVYGVVLPDEAIMLRFARLRVELRRAGRLIPDFDLLIAATALEYDLALVTRNVRHFGRIPDLRVTPPPGSSD